MKGLVYREFVRSRRSVILGLVFVIAASAIFILIALSFRVGNLALLPYKDFKEVNNSVALPLIAFLSGMALSQTSTDSEDSLLWRMFRKSIPVTPLKYAAAKSLMLAVYLAAAFVSTALLSVLFCAAADIPFTPRDFAVEAACLEIALLFSVLLQVLQAFLRSSADKAGLALAGIVIIPLSIFGVLSSGNEADSGFNPEDLIELCEKILPFTPVIIAAVFAAGFLLTSTAYKRREK